ncbi:MAG TPA: hypothetical protein VI636_11865 [Candidatus Angelobacter sp.]
MVTRLEKYVGWLLAIAALIWAAYLLAGMRGFAGAYLRLGPMQLLMAGILLWLHGKYRTSPSAQGEIGPSTASRDRSGPMKKAA